MHTEKNRELLSPGVMLKTKWGPEAGNQCPSFSSFPQTIQTPLGFPEVLVKVGPTASGSDLPEAPVEWLPPFSTSLYFPKSPPC